MERSMRHSLLRRVGSLLVVPALVASSCAGPEDSSSADVPTTTSTTSRPTTTRPTTTLAPSTILDPSTTVETPDSLAFDPEDVIAAPVPVSGPATTMASSAGGIDGYTGMLGFLGIDDVLYGAPASVPTAAPGTAPLTGLPAALPERPAVVVKIDNSPAARPQRGLNAADIVFEEPVEGGITRFAAVFHSAMTVVGPIRSGRTTDISFINAFGGPAFLYSGANRVIDALLMRQTTVQNYSASRSSGYWRDGARKVPHNLFTDAASFVHVGTAPPAQFAYGKPQGGVPTSSVTALVGRIRVAWSWEGSAWLRTQNGTAHVSDGNQVSAANVIMAVVPEGSTGLVDSVGSPVPEYIFAGSGPVAVFTGGQRIEGTWTRPSLRSPAILTDAVGNVIELTPGRTWVELVLPGSFESS